MCFIRYPNTLKLFKKNSAASCFFNLPLSVWISVETHLLEFDKLDQTRGSVSSNFQTPRSGFRDAANIFCNQLLIPEFRRRLWDKFIEIGDHHNKGHIKISLPSFRFCCWIATTQQVIKNRKIRYFVCILGMSSLN